MSAPSASAAMASWDCCDCPAWLRPGGGCLPWSPFGVCQALLPERIPGQPETPPGASVTWAQAVPGKRPPPAALLRKLVPVGHGGFRRWVAEDGRWIGFVFIVSDAVRLPLQKNRQVEVS